MILWVRRELFSVWHIQNKKSLVLAAFICGAATVQGQGRFQNLNFESAVLVPVPGDPYGSVYFSPAFPGWTASIAGVTQTTTLHSSSFLDTSGTGIIDRISNPPFNIPVIEGNYSALLQAAYSYPLQPPYTTLSQSGIVPPTAQTLLFKAYEEGDDPSNFVVTLGGVPLSVVPISTDATNPLNITLYGADIHGWAGQNQELAFTILAQRPYNSHIRTMLLDSIQFSTESIPEPGVFALSTFGTFFF